MSLRLQRGNLSNSCIVMPNISWKTSGAKWRFKKKGGRGEKKKKGEKAMVSQSQRDTRRDRSALGISCHCVRAIAENNKALAKHISKSSWTRVHSESITFCNLLSPRSLQRKPGELFQLLNKQETEKWFVWSEPASSDRSENRTSSCTPLCQALASHLRLYRNVRPDSRFQESFAERLQVDMLHLKFWEGWCLPRLTVQHISLLPMKHFLVLSCAQVTSCSAAFERTGWGKCLPLTLM